MITSPQNPRIKELARLRRSRRRREERILIDGARALSLALDAGLAVEAVYLELEGAKSAERAAAERAARAGAEEFETSPQVFAKLAYGDAPDRLVAVARRPESGLDGLPAGGTPLILVLDGIEKPGNLGAVARSADAAGATGLILCGPCDPYGPNAIRASRGTVFSLPLATAPAEAAADWLRSHGIPILAAAPDGEEPYTGSDLSGPCALVLGAEHAGVSPAWRRAAHAAITIPMAGRADSLNVAAAAAVLLFEAARQRRGSRE